MDADQRLTTLDRQPTPTTPKPEVVGWFGAKRAELILEMLAALFCRVDQVPFEQQLEAFIRSRPTGQYARRLWFLYELLTGRRLELERVVKGGLRGAAEFQRITSADLTRLQNATVDDRFADSGWRTDQVYVGEQIDLARQRIHYIAPQPADVGSHLKTSIRTAAE